MAFCGFGCVGLFFLVGFRGLVANHDVPSSPRAGRDPAAERERPPVWDSPSSDQFHPRTSARISNADGIYLPESDSSVRYRCPPEPRSRAAGAYEPREAPESRTRSRGWSTMRHAWWRLSCWTAPFEDACIRGGVTATYGGSGEVPDRTYDDDGRRVRLPRHRRDACPWRRRRKD